MPYTMEDFHKEYKQMLLAEATPEEVLKVIPPDKLLRAIPPKVLEDFLKSLKANETGLNSEGQPQREET